MSYSTHADIAYSQSLRRRVTACAAQEDVPNASQWAANEMFYLVATDWIAAWASAEAADPGGDHGANEAAVTDGMILSGVQARLTETTP